MKDKPHAAGVALIIIVLGISSFLLLYKLGSEPLQDYDEATYAEITAESLASHNFLSFTFLDQPYFNKPPLIFWLMAGMREVVTQTEVAARLPSAVSGILLIAVVMLLVFEVSGNIYIAAFGGAMLAATSSFIEPAREVRLDILVSLFIVLSVYAFMRALEDRRWFLWFGVFVGLGVLAKGPIELFAIVAVLGAACAYRRFNWLLDPYFWGGVGMSLLVALPWHIYETIKFGELFWDEYIGSQVIARIQEPLFTTGPTNFEYIQYLFTFAAPWAVAFCVGCIATPILWKKLSVKERALLLASIVGVLAVLVVCIITKTKAISYLIPLYPFMALALAMMVLGTSRFRILYIKTVLTLLCAGLLAVGFWLSVYNGFHINTYYETEVALAKEEKTIGELLLARHAPQFYIYDTTMLGSVMYYSHLVTPVFVSTSIPRGVYLLYNTADLQKLETAFPDLHLASVYQGTYLSLTISE
jgi:4-amino-4-deoxy-L-arabinose transferase-like glycosyltransferase